MDVQDKIVIITGASAGIGEATARLLTLQGANCAPKDEWRKADLAGQAASATTGERI